MKRTLIIAGFLIAAYSYLYITSTLVDYSDDPEIFAKYILGSTAITIVRFSIFLVIPAHFLLIRRAYKKHSLEFAFAAPFFIVPYMLGATAQALIL
jgi:hypothetical protein